MADAIFNLDHPNFFSKPLVVILGSDSKIFKTVFASSVTCGLKGGFPTPLIGNLINPFSSRESKD